MILTLDQFRTNFREHPTPSILEDLFAFEDVSHEFYSLAFELSVIEQEQPRDFVTEEYVSQFFGFGHDGNYSIYALWLYKSMPLGEAPVVYFNSEGEGSRVLANTLSEFLTLLAYGVEPIFGIYPERETFEHEDMGCNLEFRTWLAECYHLDATSDPNALVKNAEMHHPALPLFFGYSPEYSEL